MKHGGRNSMMKARVFIVSCCTALLDCSLCITQWTLWAKIFHISDLWSGVWIYFLFFFCNWNMFFLAPVLEMLLCIKIIDLFPCDFLVMVSFKFEYFWSILQAHLLTTYYFFAISVNTLNNFCQWTWDKLKITLWS